MKKIFIVLAMLAAINASGQWEPDVRITNDPAVSVTSYNNARCVASNGSVLHLVWYDNRDGNFEIYYKRSTDAGISWGADIRLTNNTAESYYPSIALTGLSVHVIWVDYRDGNYEIYYKRSTDAGISWGADIRLTNSSAISIGSSITVSGLVVHVVWSDYRDGNSEIYYKRSTNAGVSWGADSRLTNDTARSEYPCVAVSGEVVHVVWLDSRDGNSETYYKRSKDAGTSWEVDKRLTNNTDLSISPSIGVSSSVVHVVWRDHRDGNDEIYYKRSIDSGINWGIDTRLTINTADSFIPSVAVSGTAIHVLWEDYRDGNSEIYYKRSTDTGLSWGEDTRLTINTADSYNPSIAVSGSAVHIIWVDNRDGNSEIYYKRDPTGNPIGIQNISTEIPSAYSLSQNYPNPFNPITNVKFSSIIAGQVKLIVYDVQGRKVRTLVNESLKPGTYKVSFDGSMLNSGVYFYKLVIRHGGSSTDGFTDTKKMMLIK